MKKLKLLVLILLAVNSVSFSQTVTCITDNDTVICFSIPQSKILLTKITKGSENFELLKSCEIETSLLKELNKRNESTISLLTQVSDNKESIINNKNKQIQIYLSDIAAQKKEINRQKLYKWTAILTTGLVSVAYLLK